MRHLILFITLCLVLWVAASSPINSKRRLINRPTKEEMYGLRSRRYTDEYRLKGRAPYLRSRSLPVDLNLRKGEYECDGGVCALQPGEIPRNCNGMCQYPLGSI